MSDKNHSMSPPRNNPEEQDSPEPQTQPSPNQYSTTPSSFTASPSMETFVIPPGYKFTPTDEELISHYLKPFLQRKQDSFPNVPIHRVNIYESTPQQLSKEYKKGNDKEWFFITERTKRGEGGKQQRRRVNGGGKWKSNQVAKKIEAGHGMVGYRTSLQYHIGSEKGEWLMHEFWFESNGDNNKVDHALCKIYLTSKAVKRRAEEENEIKKKVKIEEHQQPFACPSDVFDYDYFGNLSDDDFIDCEVLEEIMGGGMKY